MRNVVKYLEKSKEKFPKKIAVIEEDQKITYEELEDKSKRVGTYLIDKINKCEPVLVFMDKGIDALISFFGTVYANGFYSLINPEFPETRIESIANTLNASVVITNELFYSSAKKLFNDIDILKIEDLINGTIQKAQEIITEKNAELENKEEIAEKVGIGAIIFNTLSSSANKDQIFDWNTALNFQGETGPYIQYTYVRTQSVLRKMGKLPKISEIDFSTLNDETAIKTIKTLYSFNDILEATAEKTEPAILARYLIELSQNYSNFYNENITTLIRFRIKHHRDCSH